MSYEYNPGSSRFEVPNPHRLENYFLLAAAAICIVAAVVALLASRSNLAAHSVSAPVSIAIAFLLLMYGLGAFGVRALRQLRFFFGRNQPVGLAQQLNKDEEGAPPDSLELRETIRQNAINYRVPTGALDNLLYSLVRDLVFSPPRTQTWAFNAFQDSLGLAFLLVCFLGALIGVDSGVARAWIGLIFFVLVNLLVIVPLRSGLFRGRPLSVPVLAVFIILVAVGPVLIGQGLGHAGLPLHGEIQFVPVTLAILGTALVSGALMFKAAIAQVVRPNQIAMAQQLQTFSMNAPPAQIFLEFDREMQRGWTDTVPNRVYLRQQPRLGDGAAGGFEGHAIEETQPVPQDLTPLSFERCLKLEAYRWLLALDLFALLATAVGAAMLIYGVEVARAWGALVIGASLLLVARFAFRGGNALWRRFEFTSRLYWLEMQGNYQRAQTSIGTFLQDRVKTQKDIVSIEDMTLRLWVAEIDSVSFGPDAHRSLMSIRGLPDEAERLSAHLADFATRQASVVAPAAPTDLQRLALLEKMNPAQSPSPAAALAQASGAALAPPATAGSRFCTQCGARAEGGAMFCGQCGSRLPAGG